MIKFRIVCSVLIIAYTLFSCNKEIDQKYERPTWLAGKVYSQIEANDSLSTFAKCIRLVGYDSIINVSGSYTVLAPTNEAFQNWFINNKYKTVEDIPKDELLRLVKYHIIQNPWSKEQLRSLDLYGWIDSLDLKNNEPKGYKRRTLLLDKNRKFGVTKSLEQFNIVDSTQSNWFRKGVTDSRKYAPFFYSELFQIYNLTSADYNFYFNRPFSGGNNIHFANAKIIGNEIFAENGFVFQIDEVVEPLKNAYQILDSGGSESNYSKFLDLVNNFPEFVYNEEKTKDQPGAEIGLVVDSLFDITYPELVFDICNEKSRPPAGKYDLPDNVSIRYHHGLMAPTNKAFDQLINEYINVPNGWGNLNAVPLVIKKIIANTHMAFNAIYSSDIEKGFYNGENDLITINESTIAEKVYGSNCTFIGLNSPIVPKAFSSVTGPIYLRPGYSRVMYAVEESGLLAALKRQNKNYMLFIESDMKLREDSSLTYDPIKKEFALFQLNPVTGAKKYNLSKNDLRTLLLNHVSVDRPRGAARKEFIPNLAGNFIVVNNETGEISGTAKTTIGYQGTTIAPNFPKEISVNADNGATYEVDNWFNFATTSIYSKLQGSYPAFFKLAKQAGLSVDKEFRFNFLSDNEFYTVFVPSDEALKSFNASTLSKDELAKFVKMHFVQGEIIFTDGNKKSGYYETARTDDKSTTYSTFYSQLYIETGIDYIRIRNKDGSNYTQVNESNLTNILAGVKLPSATQEVFSNTYNNAVIHEIDRVFIYNELDTK